MVHQSKPSSKHHRRHDPSHGRQSRKNDDQVYRITGASESVVADSERKNRIYAVLIGVRIASLFVVLLTDGWLQIAVFVGGMLAPWIGVQIANNIRQVDGRSIEVIRPQQAALQAAAQESGETEPDTVIIGDYVVEEPPASSTTPSAESSAHEPLFDENKKDHDDTRS